MIFLENRLPLFRIMPQSHRFDSMTPQKPTPARAHITPAGLMFLAITSVGWGFNWPVTKYLLSELPPLTMRGSTGVVGAALLAGLAILRGQSLRVPREMWLRLVLAAILNVACWMTLMGLALLWLPASEAALIAYTMPVWASIMAWPILGERPNLLRVISLVMAFAGLAAIMGGNGFAASAAKMPGIVMALGGAVGFAVGTVLAKKLPLSLPPLSAAAWQIGIGCLPVAIVGLLVEKADVTALSHLCWILIVYSGRCRSRTRLGQTFVEGGQQHVRRERLPQTVCCAEFESHFVKVGRGRLDIGKGIARHGDKGSLRRTFVEHPDRLKTAHVRHEDIDEHHVECRRFKRTNALFTAVGDGDVEAPVLQTDLNGLANHWVVIDHENTRHDVNP